MRLPTKSVVYMVVRRSPERGEVNILAVVRVRYSLVSGVVAVDLGEAKIGVAVEEEGYEGVSPLSDRRKGCWGSVKGLRYKSRWQPQSLAVWRLQRSSRYSWYQRCNLALDDLQERFGRRDSS